MITVARSFPVRTHLDTACLETPSTKAISGHVQIRSCAMPRGSAAGGGGQATWLRSTRPDTEGARGYRFIRGEAIVDVLAPDNVGTRADLRTVPPDRTVEVIGGSQALARARRVVIDTGDGPFRLPIPTLAGGIVIKSRVAAVATQDREKHERDLARLLALVPDVVALRDELSVKEQGYLRKHGALLDVEHQAWRGVAGAEDGVAALAFIIAPADPIPVEGETPPGEPSGS